MKILQTNFHVKWGGQAAAVLHLSRALARRGHELVIAAPPGSHLARRAVAAGLRLYDRARFVADGGIPGIIGDGRRLQPLLRAERFDVVHSNGSADGWAVSAAVHCTGLRPVVVRTRHNLKPIRRHFANRWFYGGATDHVVTVSHPTKAHTLASGLVSEDKLTMIHPAFDLSDFRPGCAPRQQLRRELGLTDEHLLVGTSARLVPEKGIDVVLRAFQRIVAREPRARLVIAGHGKQMLELKALARQLDVAERTWFCGFRADMPVVLAALDLFTHAPRTEGFGIAIAEAMAMGLPVVVTRVGGVTDFVTGGLDGVLVENEQVDELAAAILGLLGDGASRARFGAAAMQRARAFNPDTTAEHHEALYRRLLNERRP